MHFSQPTPELAVLNVRAAQEYYRDTFGFEIAWHNEEGRIGAVSHGECSIFFRERPEKASGVFWIFCDDVDRAYSALTERQADIVEPLANTPWGLRQFSARDPYGNTFHFFHDL